MESVIGPRRGYFVAAYAARAIGSPHYVGYAKVCLARPLDYWGADCVFKVFGGEHHGTPIAALAAAHVRAARQIERLPATDISQLGFPMYNAANELVFPLAQAILAKAA